MLPILKRIAIGLFLLSWVWLLFWSFQDFRFWARLRVMALMGFGGHPGIESYQATVVPKDALIVRGERRFVYVLNAESTVDLVPVETGTGVGNWIEVQGPVQPGTKVVTRGNERLRPGQKVAGQPQEYALP